MFEEDFERCFICQQPCRGLYCSSECRLQDTGTISPAVKASHAPVKLTAKLPVALSPMVRPIHHISPSPVMPAHMPNGDSSSSSSITSSPLQSPRTNPSASDSPQKEAFNLPPPAYPPHQIGFPGSVPVKIPGLVPRPTMPQPTPSHGSTVQQTGASVDTLRFGRKPGVINSVTSPNALHPRCACGKPANHRNRPSSKDREMESGFSRLALGSPLVKPLDDRSNRIHENRIVSDGALPPFTDRRGSHGHHKSISGHGTPITMIPPLSAGVGGTSLLSRSRSDPISDSPKSRPNPLIGLMIHPTPPTKASYVSPSRRASAGQTGFDRPSIRFSDIVDPSGGASPSISRGASTFSPPLAPIQQRRGRSRERHEPHGEVSAGHSGIILQAGGAHVLVGDRSRSGSKRCQDGPSRSRNRKEGRGERRRSDDRERERERERERFRDNQQFPPIVPDHAPIIPSWSRRSSVQPDQINTGRQSGQVSPIKGGHQQSSGEISPVSPKIRRNGSGEKKSKSEDSGERERRAEEVRKASNTLGQMFGVAAG